MRILFLSDLWIPFPGGAERYVFNLARELVRRGHDVTVLTSYYRAQASDGIKVRWEDVGVREQRESGAQIVRSAIKESGAEWM
jgi:glycogen synthase